MTRTLSQPTRTHAGITDLFTDGDSLRWRLTRSEPVKRTFHRNTASGRFACALIIAVTAATACTQAERDRSGSESSGEDERSVAVARTHDDQGEVVERSQAEPHPHLILEVEMANRTDKIEIELLPERARSSVDAVIQVARSGGYDRTTFHRVIPDFMIQGGDPNSRDRDPSNDGRGGSAPEIPDEGRQVPLVRGAVALANRGLPSSNSIQFFIMQSDKRPLDGKYNVVGHVTKGMAFVDAIARTETDRAGRWGPKDRPIENVTIHRATVAPPQAAE